MPAAFWVRVLACLALMSTLSSHRAHADAIDDHARKVSGARTYKLRLAAALALSRSQDPRAVEALMNTAERGRDASIRRIAVLSLRKVAEGSDAELGRRAFAVLKGAARNDKEPRVRGAAQAILAEVPEPKRNRVAPARASGAGPRVFVNIDSAVDHSNRASGAVGSVTLRVKQVVSARGYAVEWPAGGLPTTDALLAANSQGFIIGASVKRVDVRRRGMSRTEVACTVSIRVSPWLGRDGGEKWEAHRAAAASGSATAVTGGSDREIAGGIRDCVEAVAEEITSRQVLPFLRKVSS